MKCNKCGAPGPLELNVGDGSGNYPWPFDFCPFCVEREIKRYDRDAEVPGVVDRFYRNEIGRIENAD